MARLAESVEIRMNAEEKHWAEYFDGKPYICDDGVDYIGHPQLLIGRIRYYAKKRGLKMTIMGRNDKSFTFMVYKPTENEDS